MALAKAVQGSNHTAPPITWQDESGSAINLTNATLTGVMRDYYDESATARALDGALAVTDATSGIFTWTYGDTDVGTPGKFKVTFIATFSDGSIEKSIAEAFTVLEALSVS